MSPRKEVLVGLFSALVIFVTAVSVGIYVMNDPMLPAALSFSMAAAQIAEVYPLPFSEEDVFNYAERSLFHRLDPFSFRIESKEFNYMLEELSGAYGGIGISVIPRDTAIMVITVREGGPGDAAGMRSGDMIIGVGGRPVPHDDPGSIIDEIRGPSGTTIEMLLYRPSLDDTLTVRVMRADIKLDHLVFYGMTHDRAAYIRIADFEAGAAEDLRIALLGLEYRSPIGYIIDLRGNPGGYLNEGVNGADLFLDEGQLIVGMDSRSRWDNRRFYSQQKPLTTRPVVMLTDRGTASAAEIFCGALRGADRGVVVGDTTFGKGLVQSVYGIFGGDAMRLTTARYYFADGRYLNPPDSELTFSGLAPDLFFEEKGEIAFENLILSTFILYDFIDREWDFLSQLPDRETYPDTVIDLFEDFARQEGILYRSWTTETFEAALNQQVTGEGLARIVEKLDELERLSRDVDGLVYHRMNTFLKLHIRRMVVERKYGRAVAYRDVIVPSQLIVKTAADILNDESRYQDLLRGNQATAAKE